MKVNESDPNAITFRPGDSVVLEAEISLAYLGCTTTRNGIVLGVAYERRQSYAVRHSCTILRGSVIEQWGACWLKHAGAS